MPYLFALWVRNYEKNRGFTKYREVTADSLQEAYQKIIEDAFKYYMEDDDILDKVEIIAINEREDDDTDRVERE